MTASDMKAEKGLTTAILQNGDTVHINDFIYLAPEHLGEPYYIGRIMEFCTSNRRRGLQARIAWFNRPKDVINRKSVDPRLLVATMHSDVNPVSSIRGKCTVTHKYYLKETLDQYRKKPNHFYYNQLYDRYIQRVYDVVPCETIQNLPENILKALSQNYQYVVVEQGNSTNLTLARRICCVCQEWCPNNCYITCSACQKNYHLSCVNPPLTKRPSKGFAWQCAFCTRKVILGEDTENNAATAGEASSTVAGAAVSTAPRSSNIIIGGVSKETIINPGRQRTTRSQAPKPKAPEPRKETSIKLKVTRKPSTQSSSGSSKHARDEVMTEMWPFRYFGVNSDSQRVLDKNDQIYPRAQSRIGPKYQAVVEEIDIRSSPLSRTQSQSGSIYQAAESDVRNAPLSRSQNRIDPTYQPAVDESDIRGSPLSRSQSSIGSSSNQVEESDIRNSPRAQSRMNPKYQTVSEESSIRNSLLSRSQSPSAPKYQAVVEEESDIRNSPLSRSQSQMDPEYQTMGYEVSSVRSTVPAEESDIRHSALPRPYSCGDSKGKLSNRGTEDAITPIFSQPEKLAEDKFDVYMEAVRTLSNLPMGPFSSDRLDRALIELELNNCNDEIALDNMSKLNKHDFKHAVEWSREEIAAFEQSIREHGHDLNCAKRAVETKSMADVVRFFYEWKKTDRYEPVYSEWTKIYKPTKNFKKANQGEGAVIDSDGMDESLDSGEESDPTVIPVNGKKQYQCMNCQTNESTRWRRSPSDTDRKRKQFKQVLCDECGIYWLKYSTMRPVSAGVRPKRHLENPETTPPIKRKKSNEASSKPIPPKKQKEDISHLPSECKMCLEVEPEGLIYTCQICGMSVHKDCYGVNNGVDSLVWRCDPCDNRFKPIAAYDYTCMICNQVSNDPQRPMKRTSGYKWVHLHCAMFIPEVKFVKMDTLSPAEYLGCMDGGRTEQKCQLCHDLKGACVACGKCSKPVHVQCAIDNQFTLGFELETSIHENNVNNGLFGPDSPQGFMVPQVWCPNHAPSDASIVNLKDRTANTQESSLLTYAKTYKRVSSDSTPGMRRCRVTRMHPYYSPKRSSKIPSARAAALEAIAMKEVFEEHNPNIKISRKLRAGGCCASSCQVKTSPAWWSMGDGTDKKECLWCHRKKTNA